MDSLETKRTPEEILEGLTVAQRRRLFAWPHSGSTFRGEPDAVALELCDLGVGVIMPWKYGCQMGLAALGLQVRALATKDSPR